MQKKPSILKLLRQVHEDEEGAVSIETVLVVAVIALPILIFLYKLAWPAIEEYFRKSMLDVEVDID